MAITHVVLDFDGTCTQIEVAQAAFLGTYHALLTAEVTDPAGARIGAEFAARWDEAVATVAAASPDAAWTTQSVVATAPAYADPYIASGEAVAWLGRRWAEAHPGVTPRIPGDLYKRAYQQHPAPWRDEAKAVLTALTELPLTVAFVSNSSSAYINGRLDQLLEDAPAARAKLAVYGDAAKFQVRELDWDVERPKAVTKPFRKLPAARTAKELRRPIYLRRGLYYQALLRVWDGAPAPESTLYVGDIFELDLAMPIALGGQVVLVERAAPYDTCAYERTLTAKAGGKVVSDLTSLPALVGKRRGKRG